MELLLPLLPFLLKYLSITREFHKRLLKSVRQFVINPRLTQTNKQKQQINYIQNLDVSARDRQRLENIIKESVFMSSKKGVRICTDVIPLQLVGNEHMN